MARRVRDVAADEPAGETLQEKALPFLQRLESLNGDLASLRGEYMSACKSVRNEKKDVYEQAGDSGVPKKALKGLEHWRELERKQERIAADLVDDDARAYELLVEQLGPLGAFAAAKAGHTAKPETAAKKNKGKKTGDEAQGDKAVEEVDLRPRHLQQREATADEEAAAAAAAAAASAAAASQTAH